MSIRESLSRIKGKLKKRLHIGSRDTTPTPSSANRSSLSIAAPPAPEVAPAAGQDESNTDIPPEGNTWPTASAPIIGGSPGNGSPASPVIQPHTGSNDGNPTPPHTEDSLHIPPLGSVNPSLPVDTTSNDPAKADEANLVPKIGADNKASKTGLVWTGAKVLLRVVNASADAFPPLKSAVSGLKECIDIYEGVSKGRMNYGKTLEEITQLLEELHRYLLEQGAMEMTHSVKRVCCELESEVENLKSKTEGPILDQWLKAVDAPGELSECHDRIQRLLQRLILNATVNIIKKVDRQDMERALRDMLPALASTYDSGASDEIRRGGCTPGTREPQIKLLMEWARTPQTGKVYWMNGMAGTGKTTIAYSFCTKLDGTIKPVGVTELDETTQRNDVSMLAASFFCSRVIPECCQVRNIIPTIAYQLARYSLPFHSALYQILRSEHDVCTRALKTQYQKLIIEPLASVKSSLPTDFIVVIDALDECENTESLGEILNLLLSTPDTLPIRFLVSSRPEPEISQKMDGRVNEQGNTRLVLHNIGADVVKSDIAIYMRRELQDIPLTKIQWSGLLERCGVLFIYASTTCRFIREEHRLETLDEAVDAVLGSGPTGMDRGDETIIDELYTTILTVAMGSKSRMRPENRRRMRDILETVLCAGEPMQLDTLAGLLGRDSAKQVEALLKPLGSVLNITPGTKVVTTLHASFPDFMFSLDRSGKFHCEQRGREYALAKACLQAIDTVEPKFNICGLVSSYYKDDQVDLDERVKINISPALAYACRHWATHLHRGDYEEELVEDVRGFFSVNLLIWMELLNLTKCMRFGPSIIRDAEAWCSEHTVPNDISRIAHDAQQFVSVYATNAVCQSTPHIYLSMLPFWPESRPISTAYMPRAVGIVEPKGTAIVRRQTALLATWNISSGPVRSISLSADGARMVAASDDAIDILDTSTGEGVFHVQEARTSGVRAVAVSADVTRVAFGSDSGAYILDLNTRRITQLQPDEISRVLCVAFSPDGSHVAIGSKSGRVYVCSTGEANQIRHSLEGHTGYVRSVTFSPNGWQIASASDDRTVRVWDTKNGQMAGDPLRGHNDWVLSVSFSPNGKLLASASDDGTIRLWAVQTGQTILGPLEGHSNGVLSVTFSPDGTFIASGSADTTIRVYDTTTGQTILGPLQAHTSLVRSVIVSPDSARLFSCSSDGTIRLWNVQDRHVPDTQHTTVPREFWCVRYSPDGSRVVSGSVDGAVCVWDVQTGDIVLGPLQGHASAVLGVDYSPDGAYIASASQDSTLRIWSAQDGKDIHGPIQGHTSSVYCVRFSADSLLLVSGSDDKTVRIWDVQTGKQLNQPLRGHSGSVWTVAFSPNRSHVVSGSSDHTIRVWDIQTGQTVIYPLQGHQGTVGSVEFSSDGSRILSGSSDKSIRIWDAVTGQSLLVFGQGHGSIFSVGFSPDGGLVISGSSDGTVCVWNAQSGQLMLTLDGHTQSVESVQMSPDGSHVVSCSRDGAIRFWDVSSCQAHVRDDGVKGTSICDYTFRFEAFPYSFLVDDGERSDYSQVEAVSRPWVLRDDGWVADRQDRRLVWVPSDLQPYTRRPPNDSIIPRGYGLELDFSGVNMGEQWTRCYRA